MWTLHFFNRDIVNFHRSWCETCKGLSSPSCQHKKHKITEFIAEDVEEHDTFVVQVESGAQDALDKRNEGEEPLLIEEDQLQVKLDAVKAQVKENRVHKEKLLVVIANCQKMKQLHGASKATKSLWKNLKEMQKEVEEEGLLADNFLKQITTKIVGRVDEVTFNFYV